MMKRLSFSVLFFCLYMAAHAQSLYKTHKTDSLPKPRLIIKWAPLSIIDIDPTVQFGVEYLLGGKWSIQQELGYGPFNYSGIFSPDGDEMRNKEIWRSRTEARLYLSNYRPKPTGAYIAFEMLYKRLNYKSEEQIGRDCENGNCGYRETVSYKFFKDVTGFHLKFGAQTIIQKRVPLDFYIGIGGRNATVKVNNKELEEIWKESRESFIANPTRPGSYGLISGSLGFKVGYLLYK